MQLRIMSLEKTDFGRYHCKAKNNLGTDSDQAVLIGKVKFHTCLTFFMAYQPKKAIPLPPQLSILAKICALVPQSTDTQSLARDTP